MLRIVIILITLYSKEKEIYANRESSMPYTGIHIHNYSPFYPQGTAYPLNSLNITLVYDLSDFRVLLPPT
jgi:hypothetical protein